MQWRRKRRVLCVIGSANHALLVKQYRYPSVSDLGTEEEGGISLEPANQKSTEEQRITFNEGELYSFHYI